MNEKLRALLSKHGINQPKKYFATDRNKGKSNNSKVYQKADSWLDGSWEWNPITKETTYYSVEETKRRDKERNWTPVSNTEEYLKTPGPKIIKKKEVIWNKETK